MWGMFKAKLSVLLSLDTRQIIFMATKTQKPWNDGDDDDDDDDDDDNNNNNNNNNNE